LKPFSKSFGQNVNRNIYYNAISNQLSQETEEEKNVPAEEPYGDMRSTFHQTSEVEAGHKPQDPIALRQGTCRAGFCNPDPVQVDADPNTRERPCEDAERQPEQQEYGPRHRPNLMHQQRQQYLRHHRLDWIVSRAM
jgi:hypothetical protein